MPFFNDVQALAMTQQSSTPAWRSHASIYVLMWLLLLSAGARPQLQGELLEQPTTGRDLLIAVDVS